LSERSALSDEKSLERFPLHDAFTKGSAYFASLHTTYEVDDETLTIWGGEKGSPAYYKGKWSDDGNTNTGAWHYPGGGGYEATMTRVK